MDRDLAAGSLVDSLLDPIADDGRVSNAATKALGGRPSKASIRPQWTARLARNPNPGDGNPAFVLIDRYGGIQRYVEQSPSVDLKKHLGQTVSVRRDTGHTLLASQLDLPRTPRRPAANSAKQNGDVKLAAFEEMPSPEPTLADGPPSPTAEPLPSREVVEGEIIEGQGPLLDEQGQPLVIPEGVDPLYLDGGMHDEGLHFDGCDMCGSKVCKTPGGCGYGSRPIVYAHGEYLLWWFDGMNTPPLVAAADNPQFQMAEIIYGGDEILDEARHGGRITLGYFMDDYGHTGIEGEYLALGVLDETFVAGNLALDQSNVPPYIGRPFFNTAGVDADGDGDTNDPGDIPRGPLVEEVETDGLSGTVRVRSESDFRSAGIRLRRALCCIPGSQADCGDMVGCGDAVGCGPMGCGMGVGGASPYARFFSRGTRRFDLITGFRWTVLDESLSIEEDLTSLADGTTFLLNDNFATSNRFTGGEVGFLWEWLHNQWSLEFLSKVAIGNTRQRVFISGSTLFDRGTADEDFATGGLLTQNSNIGAYERDELSVIPELGFTVGYMLTDRLRFTAGYTFLYWSNVVRPGDQIDTDVNVTQIPRFAESGGTPDVVDPISMDHPRFAFQQSDLWVNGLNLGLEYQW
jgi:Putative beta barrel porin-7 (BBP7)